MGKQGNKEKTDTRTQGKTEFQCSGLLDEEAAAPQKLSVYYVVLNSETGLLHTIGQGGRVVIYT